MGRNVPFSILETISATTALPSKAVVSPGANNLTAISTVVFMEFAPSFRSLNAYGLWAERIGELSVLASRRRATLSISPHEVFVMCCASMSSLVVSIVEIKADSASSSSGT